MKKVLRIIFVCLLLPKLAYAQSSGDMIMWSMIILIMMVPYYLFALIPYFIQKKNDGKSAFLSFLTYALCLTGIVVANYQEFRFRWPGFNSEEDLVFYLLILPFIIITILAVRKDYKYWISSVGK